MPAAAAAADLALGPVFQGLLVVQDQYRAVMQYSLPKDGLPPEHRPLQDWFCIKVRWSEVGVWFGSKSDFKIWGLSKWYEMILLYGTVLFSQ